LNAGRHRSSLAFKGACALMFTAKASQASYFLTW
jgi:hypothetical protein